MLTGVNVALGVTGSIAAVRVVELVHELQRHGASVRAIMTDSAMTIVHPWAIEFATGAPVVTEITGQVEHIELCGNDGWADVFLVAPATANTIGKMAAAIDDTSVTTCASTAIGAGVPLVLAPAMHEPMYDHPGIVDAIDRLREWNVTFVEPRIEEGKAKIATDDDIVLEIARTLDPNMFDGREVVVTSGATIEPIDPVRVLTNRSSGKTGRAIARALYAAGADVTLVHNGPSVSYATVKSVETADEMHTAVEEAVETADLLISAAAISDYTVTPNETKIPSGETLSLELQHTQKLIDSIRRDHPGLPIVGFKTETNVDDESLIDNARRVLNRVDLLLIVANDASVMNDDETRVFFVRADDATEFKGSKTDLGVKLVHEIAPELGQMK